MHSLQCIVYEMLMVQLQDREFLSSTTQYFSYYSGGSNGTFCSMASDPALLVVHCNWIALVALVLNNSPEWLAY